MHPDPSRPRTVAREETERGTVALRRRDGIGDPIWELIVNGTFAMDTVDTSTERLLARAALGEVADPSVVVVAGLGLGFTAREVLTDPRVRRVDVVELEPVLLGWVRDGLVPDTAGILEDPRVHPHVADIRHWLPDRPDRSVDAVLLDVDNGPGFLIHRANAGVYEAAFLAAVGRTLRAGGVLAVWSASPSAALRRALRSALGSCVERRTTVRREGRILEYVLYLAVREAVTPDAQTTSS